MSSATPEQGLYRVIKFVTPGELTAIEQMGTRPKFWFTFEGTEQPGMFKRTRQEGEAWAECVAADLAEALNLPHADYSLAVHWGEDEEEEIGKRGVISWSFLQKDESLILGNEILAALVSGYPRSTIPRYHRVRAHTVECVLEQCQIAARPLRWETPPPSIENGADVIVGYLMLDAWIANTDRHDENWAWVRLGERSHLAPTFDHSSSLGRNEPDAKREARLRTRDRGFNVERYALEGAWSGVHRTDGTQMRTIEAFERAAALNPRAADTWLSRLAAIPEERMAAAVARVPRAWMSAIAAEFATGILMATRRRLLAGAPRN